jgi:penicillin-binding protein 1A
VSKRPPKLRGTERPTLSFTPTTSAKRRSWLRWINALFRLTPRKEKKTSNLKPTKRKQEKVSIKWILFKLFMTLSIWGTTLAGLAVLWFSYDLPDINRLQSSVRKPGVVIQAFDGTIIGTYGDLYEDMVKLHELPPYVPQAIMAIEDRRFFTHFGIDVFGLVRAAYVNFKADRVVQGGSTLTQQLAKNFLLTQGMYEPNDRSLRRKIQEVILAFWLEWKFTKEQIFTIYLNRVYFGAGTYGIDAAARKYFHKPAQQLTVYEAAVIAGLLKAPSRYSPASHPQRARERATVVLHQMVEAGYIRDTQEYLKQTDQMRPDETDDLEGAKFFADWVFDSIPNLIGEYDQDLVIQTTFDPKLQRYAEMATKKMMAELGKELNTSEMSFVAMTPNGAVKAMIGGMSYSKSQYNRATQALRQPGSAFKAFVYLAALEAGITPETLFSDEPFSVGNWSPKNFRTYKPVGEITLTDAFVKSVNAVTVRLAMQVGGPKIAAVARRLGITSEMITDLSICLGTTEVTLVELVAAFATFANQGLPVWPYGIVEIRNKKGEILYQRQEPESVPVIQPQYVYQMVQMLTQVVERGTGRGAKIGYPVAGKTGSNGDKDAWFIGFTSDLVAGTWTGNDNNKPMKKNSTGGRLPAKTFAEFMKLVVAESPPSRPLLPAPPAAPEYVEESGHWETIATEESTTSSSQNPDNDTQGFQQLIESLEE